MQPLKRPDHIEDYLTQLHTGQWFGWSDSQNKIYSNLILHPKVWNPEYTGNKHEEGLMDNPHSLPTEKECIDGLKLLQDSWDAYSYIKLRKKSYPNINEQLDDLFHQGAFSKEMTAKIQKVKDEFPKPE